MTWSATYAKFKPTAALFCTLIGGVLGYFGHDFLSYKAEIRAEQRSNVQQLAEARSKLEAVVQKYADVATGSASMQPDIFSDLRTEARSVDAKARALSLAAPAVNHEYQRYSDALLHLQQSAEKVTGPRDGKPFIEALSAYIQSEQLFDKAVSKQNTFL